MNNNEFEVIIIGGSYAGLSAAMVLGRSLRKTLVIDADKPCNRQTPHSHNFLTQDGSTPKEIATVAKSQVSKYSTVTFYNGFAKTGKKMASGFEISTDQGVIFKAQKLVFATGIKDLMPNIKGFSDCWGISVVHCPYCHGYEIRGKKTMMFADAEKAFHLAPLVKNLTDDFTILASGAVNFDQEQKAILQRNNIKIISKEILEVKHDNGQLHSIVFTDGSSENFDAMYAAIPFEQSSAIPEALGCDISEHGYITVNAMNKTSVEGVFACGDNCAKMRSVANAVYTGNITGAVLNKELADQKWLSFVKD